MTKEMSNIDIREYEGGDFAKIDDNYTDRQVQAAIANRAEKAFETFEDLKEEVEEIKNNPDVVDIVATYADLQAYDTQHLTDKDIIRVLADENHDGESTYYRYSKQGDSWTYIGESKQYTDFVGTDGQTAGTSGLVPAPATTDAGKYLKADGTWDTVSAGPTVVQTTGQSTTDVMSQKAVTDMVYNPSTSSSLKSVLIGEAGYYGDIYIGNDKAPDYRRGVKIGCSQLRYPTSNTTVIVGNRCGVDNINRSGVTGIGDNVKMNNDYTVCLGSYSKATEKGQMDISTSAETYSTTYGYNDSQYRLLTGLYDPQSAHDAATKGYVDGKILTNAGAPTTATVGTVGQLYEDTTNGKLYQCTAVSGNTYTWSEVGAGGGGGITTLTSADYDYPSSDPTYVALWNLDSGLYFKPSDVSAKLSTTKDAPSGSLFIVVNYSSNSDEARITTIGGDFTGGANNKNYGGVQSITKKASGSEQVYTAFLTSSQVQNNLYSTSGVLSAQQGKTLNGKITPTTGSGAPTTTTAALIGKIYIDTDTNTAYMCVKSDTVTPEYTWKQITA